ncbi:hypothetical protein OMA37_004210 [Vibrio fluvialis]|uniref:hypothetical protein n=1 Tax=Vibrio fluvialis TaxID=676 RepID=UPI0011C02751|nr:hypothetical protein [Vibrio fluvialis]EKO3392379.1 hypothetical protein [Vibrio fluvialis]EKO3952976.1 hypothetical protein [Vibrio fluvialis]ELI1831541.1 hypothetical protein [Vibrio fluvialis]MBY8083107.1 hypothetical protein [Vibrio fluvialis]MBY8091622.1 hypothetical protein [Vibrio fluvialis]
MRRFSLLQMPKLAVQHLTHHRFRPLPSVLQKIFFMRLESVNDDHISISEAGNAAVSGFPEIRPKGESASSVDHQ